MTKKITALLLQLVIIPMLVSGCGAPAVANEAWTIVRLLTKEEGNIGKYRNAIDS